MTIKNLKMLLSILILVGIVGVIVLVTFNSKERTDLGEKIKPTPAKWTMDTSLGSEFPSLDYTCKDYIIFHDYFGLFVYDLNTRKLTKGIDLESIGCHYTQGSNVCNVVVSEDGSNVYLHPLEEKNMYVYNIKDNIIYSRAYDKKLKLIKNEIKGGIIVLGQRVNCLEYFDNKESYKLFTEEQASE